MRPQRQSLTPQAGKRRLVKPSIACLTMFLPTLLCFKVTFSAAYETLFTVILITV